MHHHIAAIDDRPVAGLLAFHHCAAKAVGLDPLGKMVGDRGDVTGGAARRDDHHVGIIGPAFQVDRNDFLGLVVVELGEDKLQQLFKGLGAGGFFRRLGGLRGRRLFLGLGGSLDGPLGLALGGFRGASLRSGFLLGGRRLFGGQGGSPCWC